MGMMLLQSTIDGLILGGVYATVAMGLSMCFGIMGILNWAHGEILMVAMYIAYALVNFLGMDPYLTILVTAPCMFLIGWLLQKFVFNSLLRKDVAREPMSVLLSTAGLGMLLSNLAIMLIGSKYFTAKTVYSGKSIWLGEIMISLPRILSFVLAIVSALALYFLLHKTNWGRALRATSQNRQTAQLMGIPNDKVFNIAFGLSLAMVGIAASLLIPNFAVSPDIGMIYGNRCFTIVVLGGKGDVKGTLIGGLIIGLIERLGAILFNESIGQMLVFIVFVAIVLWKPQGIFSQRAKA